MTQLTNKKTSPDWLVQGLLTKIGDIFDRLTGRRWKPSSSLATSQLIERLKFLLDSEIDVAEDGKRYAPHNIKLKMQWDKFATDSEKALKTIENEFLVAAIDHINDRHYYTHAPLSIEVKPDYFTEGVRLFASFAEFPDDHEEAQINVSLPGDKDESSATTGDMTELTARPAIARFTLNGRLIEKNLSFGSGSRLSVGRTKENDLAIDDISVSKYHASLLLDSQGSLMVADTGSTNGTFINGERIAYGKALMVRSTDKLKFGGIEVSIILAPAPAKPELEKTEAFRQSETIGGFEFIKKTPVPVAPIENNKNTEVLPAAAPPAAVPPKTEQMPAEQPPITLPSVELFPTEDRESEKKQ